MSSLLQTRQANQDDAWADFKMWHYTPSVAASIIFTTFFVTMTTFHAYLLIRRRTYFCIPFVVGGTFEVIGYIARAAAHGSLESIPLYSIQYLALLLAPILFAASIYMILGRIVKGVNGEEYCVIRVNWLTKIFVGCDVLCFLIQIGGGSMLATAKTKDKIDLCNSIVLGGLIFQIVVFGGFVVAAGLFHLRMRRGLTGPAVDGPLGRDSRVGAWGRWRAGGLMAAWERLMIVLYVTSVLITLRNLFRVVEYAMGWNNYLLGHEWVLLAFDGALMFGVLVICVVCHDPEISKGKKSGQQKLSDDMAIIEGGRAEQSVKETIQVQGDRIDSPS